MNPLIRALRELGGSGSIKEIDEKVLDIENIDEEIAAIPHGPSGSQTEVAYRLAWVRTSLKIYGLLENSSRGVWALTKRANEISTVDPPEVERFVKRNQRNSKAKMLTKKNRDDGQR